MACSFARPLGVFMAVLSLALPLASGAAAGEGSASTSTNLVKNPALLPGGADGAPKEWKLSRAAGVDAEVAVREGAGPDGVNALAIVNRGAHVSRAALRQFLPLRAGNAYEVSCRIKGTAGKYLSFALGNKWQHRLWLRTSGEWRSYRLRFVADAGQFSWKNAFELCLLSEDEADMLVADLRVVPVDRAALLVNGDFSEVDPDGRPGGWRTTVAKGVAATVAVRPGVGPRRTNALHIKNETAYATGKYVVLRQFPALRAGREYELTCWARGRSGGYLSFAQGNKWSNRLWLKGLAAEAWKPFRLAVRPQDGQFAAAGAFEIALLCEDICDAEVADVALRPLNALTPLSENFSPATRLAVIPRTVFDPKRTDLPPGLPSVGIDLAELPGVPPPSREDLSARVAMGYDDQGAIFYVRVTDDRFVAKPGENLWNGDSVQIRVGPGAALADVPGEHDHEIGLTRYNDAPENYSWKRRRALVPGELDYAVTPTPDGYFVAARLAWSELGGAPDAFSFVVAVNDTDDGQLRKTLATTPGLVIRKGNRDAIAAVPDVSSVTHRLWLDSPTVADGVLRGRLLLRAPGKPVVLRLERPGAESLEKPLHASEGVDAGTWLVAEMQWDVAAAAGGEWSLVLDAGGQALERVAVTKVDYGADCAAARAAFDARYAALRPRLVEQEKHPRLAAARRIADRQLALLDEDAKRAQKQDQKDYYAQRSLRILGELDDLADRAEQALAALEAGRPPAPESRYASSARVLENGYFSAETVDADGRRQRRPVIFSGYGHFTDVLREMPLLSGLGADFLQVEIGPRHVLTGENPDGTFQVDLAKVEERLAGFDRAWENNLAICLLLSPHYFPDWALAAHPEVAWNSGSFLRYDVQHPYGRAVVAAAVRATLRALKARPGAAALHSVCLTNEPRYLPSLASPFTRQRYADWLARRYHNDLEPLNTRHNARYAAFADAAPEADPLPDGPSGPYYDFMTFRLDEMADWHRWLAGLVEEEWPGMPVHAKALAGFGLAATSLDYERLGALSTVPGTDASLCYRQERRAFARGDRVFPLIVAANPSAIVNSENHLVADVHEDPAPYDAVYTALFQQFVGGVGHSAAWVWADYSMDMTRKRHDLSGSVYRRPAAQLAIRDASADANRVVDTLAEAFRAPAEVAVLYSVPSGLLAKGFEESCERVVAALARTGRKVRYLSESQLANGETQGVRALLLADAAVMDADAAKALAGFVAGGGTVLTLGRAPSRDPYGAPLPELPPLRPVVPGELAGVLDQALGTLPVRVATASETVEWRLTPRAGGGWMLNLVEFGDSPSEVELSAGGTDLLRGDAIPAGRYRLSPRQPHWIAIPAP